MPAPVPGPGAEKRRSTTRPRLGAGPAAAGSRRCVEDSRPVLPVRNRSRYLLAVRRMGARSRVARAEGAGRSTAAGGR